MLSYSIQGVGQRKPIHIYPWNGTSFPQHPVAVMACRRLFVAAAEVRIRTRLLFPGGQVEFSRVQGLSRAFPSFKCFGLSGQGEGTIRLSWVKLFEQSDMVIEDRAREACSVAILVSPVATHVTGHLSILGL